jgi:hypothetical protein
MNLCGFYQNTTGYIAYGMKARRTLNEKERKKPVEMKTASLKLTEIFFALFPPSSSLLSVCLTANV